MSAKICKSNSKLMLASNWISKANMLGVKETMVKLSLRERAKQKTIKVQILSMLQRGQAKLIRIIRLTKQI